MSRFASLASVRLPSRASLREVLLRATASAVRTLPLALILASSLAVGCSGTSVGTPDGSSGTSGTTRQPGSTDTTVGGGVGTAPPVGSSTPSPAGNPYEALFGKPSTTALTPGMLTGVWAGTMYSGGDDVRVKITADAVTIAVRCDTQPAVGMEVSAVVRATSIRLLESKNAEATVAPGIMTLCPIRVRPQTIPSCVQSSTSSCFRVDGDALRFNDVLLFTAGSSQYGHSIEFTKLSD